MQQTSEWLPHPSVLPWPAGEEIGSPAVPTILLVEDDRDIRQMMTTLFRIAGFAAIVCDTAEAGLAALREHAVDLILTDYVLPEHSGTWLLHEATAQGLIEDTPAFIVTAHPDLDAPQGCEVIRKPFDLDDLVERLRRRMDANRRVGRKGNGGATSGDDSDGGGSPGCPEPVELILYVSTIAPGSSAAIAKIRDVLAQFSTPRVKLTVCELPVAPAMPVDNASALTAGLGRRTPGPRTFIIGHLTSPELVLELLGECGSP